MWEESRLARKQMSRAQRRLDTKLLCNQCGLAKTLFNRKYQDTHNCPVCNAPCEDRDHLYKCPDADANKVFKKGIDELEKILEEKETAPELHRAIVGNLMGMRSGSQPRPATFGRANFGRGLSISVILSDQAEIGWINFFSGRWSVKWKEAQKRHYRNMNKRKSAKSWAVAILKKLMMIRWDLWEYRNSILHSPTGPIALASHHSLNYKISEEKAKGMDGIARSNAHLFSAFYSNTKLHSGDIPSKILWLEMVRLAREEYEEPNSARLRQAISHRAQMQEFLITNGPLVPIPVRPRPKAVQHNPITVIAQQDASVLHFGNSRITASPVAPPVIPLPTYTQRTLLGIL